MAVSSGQLHFQSIPWCVRLLQEADLVETPTTGSRGPKPRNKDTFWAETLQTPSTIRACLSVYRAPPNDDPDRRIEEVLTFLDLGAGVTGYPGVCHGGFVAVALDEVTGILLVANLDRDEAKGKPRASVLTASLNVKYLKPLPTPGVVLLRAKFKEVVGKKRLMEGTVEDGEGTIYAIGEALYVEVKGKL